ncbi:MBL fold metallo-hydrolase [Sulfurihydrogenibium azorense]|uniref:MBL fold metallo-hydrolase n=1 Tax=Sulfurihydrogenibium azorense TaxID=309806 RepID=UPI00240A7CC8|nr:MBL fold metallo-hydrolase [Sulfurihydrogenibium azorense]MDM7274439.1 MBL fold metallo-hydrolase [Sulfurihydrogenibium azorense]
MKKIFFVVLLLIVSNTFAMDLKQFYKNMYMVRGVDAMPSVENRGFMSNAYAILTKEGWIVIDSLSTPELSKEFYDELMKVKKAPIKYLIITHYHPDHWYGASTFKQAGATVIAHKKLNEFYNSPEAKMTLEVSNQRFGGLYKNVKLIPADVEVSDKKDLKVGEYEISIISMTPAHTNNDIVVFVKNEKVLFAGDLVYINRIPFAGDRGASSKNWLKVLNEMKNLNPKIILGGHNEPMDIKAIDFTYNYLEYTRSTVKKLKEQGKSLDEIKAYINQNSPYKNYVMYDVFNDANVYKIYNDLDLEDFE